MKVDTMRRIDYWAGVPLCFAGGIIHKLFGWLRKKPPASPKNVLLIELSEMGSAILVDPAMRILAREGNCQLYFAIFKKNKPSLDLLGTVPQEHIYTIREHSLFAFVWDTLMFFHWTRKKKIDAVIDLELFSRFTALMTGFSGASRRVGFHAFFNEGLYRGSFLTHRVAYNPHMHIAKNFVALVYALLSGKEEVPFAKTQIPDETVRLAKASVTQAEKQAVRDQIAACYRGFDPDRHPVILINPNASELLIQRRWPPDHFVALMKMILEACPSAVVLITGDPKEREEAQGLKERTESGRCVNFAGQVTFAQLPHLYSVSQCMISNDSGPPHFASVTDMPTYVLFGPETPALYGSLGATTPIYASLACSPCVSASNHRKTACRDNVCLQVIEPDHVFDIIRPILEKINALGR